MHAGDALVLHEMRAEAIVKPEVSALGGVVVVHRSKDRSEGIGIDDLPGTLGV